MWTSLNINIFCIQSPINKFHMTLNYVCNAPCIQKIQNQVHKTHTLFSPYILFQIWAKNKQKWNLYKKSSSNRPSKHKVNVPQHHSQLSVLKTQKLLFDYQIHVRLCNTLLINSHYIKLQQVMSYCTHTAKHTLEIKTH